MLSATFFGYRDFNYSPYREKVRTILTNLIKNHGVENFYNGFRGNFDRLCAEVTYELKTSFPFIKNIMVLSYLNRKDGLPEYFDESVYLLEKRVPARYAIYYTNREIILHTDFVVSGVRYHYGGAFEAYRFAKRKKKTICEIFEET